MSIKNFKEFTKINESLSTYKSPGIQNTWGGGYEMDVADLTSGDDPEYDRALVVKKNGTSICLGYLGGNKKTAGHFWVPLDAVELSKNGEKISKVVFDPYKKWITLGPNLSKVEDFIENLLDYSESGSKENAEILRNKAKDDVEILLDLLGINSNIDHFSDGGEDNSWEALLKNGGLVEIKKRSDDDLMGSFKIYKNHKDSTPAINIKNLGNSKISSFNLGKDIDIEEPIGISAFKSKNPYYNFLKNKSLGFESSEDKESMINHYSDFLKKNTPHEESDDKEKEMKRIGDIRKFEKVLSSFLTTEEIESYKSKPLIN